MSLDPMSIDRTALLARARDVLARQLRRYPVKVYLFGSFASGTESHSSDIDVAIESEAPLPPGVLARLREELEESDIPRRVEVVDLRDSDPAFRARVRKEGIPWSVSRSA
jgi:predicted nucleotidyltransferase